MHLLIGSLVVYAGFSPIVARRRILTCAWVLAAAALLALFAMRAASTIRTGLVLPPVWDFGALWLYGRVADVTHQPYEPSAIHAIGAALNYGQAFTREVLDVGFVYPPPTIALFAPLGLFQSPSAAIPFWYTFLALALALEIILLWRQFLRRDRWIGLILATLIVVLQPTTLSVLAIGQTQFLVAVFFLLYLRENSVWRRGVWLALGGIVKPFLFLLLLDPFVRKEWRTIVSAIVVAIAATIIVLPLIGWHSVVAFVSQPPTSRLPYTVLTDVSNQSLLAWIVRSMHVQGSVSSALHHPLYLLAAALLIAVTLWVILRVLTFDREYGLVLLLPVSILIYPENWWHYTSMLVIPMCFLWSRRDGIPGGSLLVWAFTASEFFLSTAYNCQFFASFLAWLVLIALSPFADRPLSAEQTRASYRRIPTTRYASRELYNDAL